MTVSTLNPIAVKGRGREGGREGGKERGRKEGGREGRRGEGEKRLRAKIVMYIHVLL